MLRLAVGKERRRHGGRGGHDVGERRRRRRQVNLIVTADDRVGDEAGDAREETHDDVVYLTAITLHTRTHRRTSVVNRQVTLAEHITYIPRFLTLVIKLRSHRTGAARRFRRNMQHASSSAA